MYDIKYEKPASLEHALALKNKWKKDGVFIAGGSNVLIYLKDKKIMPGCFIDISELEAIRQIEYEDEVIKIGPEVTIAELERSDIIQSKARLLFQASREFANPLIKNRATIGGNIADASPASDMAPPLLALDAHLTLMNEKEKRSIPLRDFFISPRKTTIKDNEMIAQIAFKEMKENERASFIKLGNRNATTISVVSVAVWLSLIENTVQNARIALGSVAPTHLLAVKTGEALLNQTLTDALVTRACESAKQEVRPISDIRASEEYRKEMSAALLKKALYCKMAPRS